MQWFWLLVQRRPDIKYFKHGTGCNVDLPDGAVDFDFGSDGEISGLDVWRLGQFAKQRPPTFGFATDKEMYDCFNNSVNQKLITPLNSALYSLANQPIEYASGIDSRHEADLLPHREHDTILTLQIHYFYAADLMLKNYDNLERKWDKKQKLSRTDEINFRIYITSWLGFLAVTCEGYRKLNMYLLLNRERPAEYQELIPKCKKLNRTINQHYHDLRKFRNNVFHLRSNTEDTLAFLTPWGGRLSWARSIHSDLKSFFSEYRILCELHYMSNGRRSEGEFGQKKKEQ
ncbi:DUF6896 domain-containing protein [Pseudomonas helleri]|uniref:DUF6896 domain-containing protein n=1 Tax=Pseudomonas helleri TaxID=1608996 RepID=UPI003FD5A759